jgi:phosphate/sulfate permease
MSPLSDAVLAATSHSSNNLAVLLLAGPVVGVLFAFLVFHRYRNTNKTDQYERETEVKAEPVQAHDQKVREIHGTQESHTRGRNENAYRKRVQRI